MIHTLMFGAGRMAQSILELAWDYPNVQFVAQVSRSEPLAAQSRIPWFSSLEQASEQVADDIDLLIDFTLPEGTLAAASWCNDQRVALLSGVTGIDASVQRALDAASKSVPVLWAANLSFGINLLAGMLRELAGVIGDSASITIEESHHAGKQDAPSGTALFLARQLRRPADGKSGADPKEIAQAFPDIVFRSQRQGDVVGDHSVTVDLSDETLTLAHHARERRLFARGALDAGVWLMAQPAGRYTAADWIHSAVAKGISGSNGQA